MYLNGFSQINFSSDKDWGKQDKEACEFVVKFENIIRHNYTILMKKAFEMAQQWKQHFS